jgi:hypothetical protein
MSHLPDSTAYSSVVWFESESFPKVTYSVRKVSLMQRIELTKAVRALLHQHEFLRAGGAEDEVGAKLAELMATKLYLELGLVDIKGLEIDGQECTKESLLEKGPEVLSIEIAQSIRAQLSLSEEERKNF